GPGADVEVFDEVTVPRGNRQAEDGLRAPVSPHCLCPLKGGVSERAQQIPLKRGALPGTRI
ncbi:hypothetical protein B8W95_13470, partial [Staphylococcus pasteuri]